MSDVTFSMNGPVAVIRLDDGKANAFRPATIDALNAAMQQAEASGAGAVLFVGRPGFFSGGLDLKVLPTLDPAEKLRVITGFSELMLRVFGFGRPTVAALTGHAIAGGALLALACDVRLAIDAPARIAINEVAIGIAMPRLGVEIARAAIPVPSLTEALLHGRTFTYPEALERRIVESLHGLDVIEEAALRRAGALALLPAAAYAETKERLLGGAIAAARAALESERGAFAAAFSA